MTATYPSVNINGTEYETLAELGFVENYLAADPDGEAFLGMTEDQKGQRVVLASRVINSKRYLGSKTDPAQPYAFPRSNVTIDGQALDPDSIPEAVAQAVAELAKSAANGVDIANFRTTASTQKTIKAGPVMVENFRDEGPRSPLPWPAWALLLPFVTGSTGASGKLGARSNGTCGETVTQPGFGYAGPL